jgi:hypothetical protein
MSKWTSDPKTQCPISYSKRSDVLGKLFIHRILNKKSGTQDNQEHGAGGGDDVGDEGVGEEEDWDELVSCTVEIPTAAKGNSLTATKQHLSCGQGCQPHRVVDIDLDEFLCLLPVINREVQISCEDL